MSTIALARVPIAFCAGALLGVALWACSSFGEGDSDSDDGQDAAPQGADSAVDGAQASNDAGGSEASATFACEPMSPRVVETFDSDVLSLVQRTDGNGKLVVENGVLAATVAAESGSRAYFAKSISVPQGMKFSHARLKFTLKELTWPPDGFFLEAGCMIEFNQNDNTRTSVRLELRPNSMLLDDQQTVDGGPAETGAGPELTGFLNAPTDYVVTLDVAQNAEATELTTVGHVAGRDAQPTKKTPLAGDARIIEVHCGINQTSVGAMTAATSYTLKMDDVEIDVCRAP